jgi:phage recombination protein Bet
MEEEKKQSVLDNMIDAPKRIDAIEARLDKMAAAFRDLTYKVDKLTQKKAEKDVIDKETEALIKKVTAPFATDDEFKTLMHLSRQYDLDPLKKEIYFIKYDTNSKGIILTSRDGYLKIANADKSFDGMEGDVVYLGDIIMRRADTSISISYGENHLKFDKAHITGAFCNIYRNDRSKPTSVFVSLKDYDKKKGIWEQCKNAMILKVAESMALKRAFALSGLASSEEVEGEKEE